MSPVTVKEENRLFVSVIFIFAVEPNGCNASIPVLIISLKIAFMLPQLCLKNRLL